MKRTVYIGLSVAAAAILSASSASAECSYVTRSAFVTALKNAANADSSGLNNNYWGVLVERDGTVCEVAFSGAAYTDQWLLSRQIASAKAFTAVGLSLNGSAIGSGTLYAWVQGSAKANYQAGFAGFAPANPLFGLEGGNVQNSAAALVGGPATWGTASDPMVGQRPGGTITFGGGLPLYKNGALVGGLGLSGDTACADHSTAWRTRANMSLAPGAGVSRSDFIHLTTDGAGHPRCPNDANTQGTN